MPQDARFGRVGFFEDFQGALAQTFSDATEYRFNDIRIAAISGDVVATIEADEPNGVMSFSGAGGAADGVALYSMPFQPSTQGRIEMGARWQTGGVTSYGFFVGWQETVSVAEPVNPFTLSGTSLTSNNGGNVWGIYFDTAATTADVRALSSLDGAENTTAETDDGTAHGALGIRANVSVVADSYMVARIAIDNDGRGEAWFGLASDTGPKLIATIKAGTLDRTAFYHPIVILVDPSTNDPLHSVDYFGGHAGRSWSA